MQPERKVLKWGTPGTAGGYLLFRFSASAWEDWNEVHFTCVCVCVCGSIWLQRMATKRLASCPPVSPAGIVPVDLETSNSNSLFLSFPEQAPNTSENSIHAHPWANPMHAGHQKHGRFHSNLRLLWGYKPHGSAWSVLGVSSPFWSAVLLQSSSVGRTLAQQQRGPKRITTNSSFHPRYLQALGGA